MIKKPAKLIEFVPTGQTSGHEIRARSIVLKDGALNIRLCYQNGAKKMQNEALNGEFVVLLWKNKNKTDLGRFLIKVNNGIITGVKL